MLSRDPALEDLLAAGCEDDEDPLNEAAVRSPAAREATVSRDPVLREDEDEELESDAAVFSPAARDATVSRDPLFLDEDDELLEEDFEELDDVLAGERSALLPEPVSIAMVVS